MIDSIVLRLGQVLRRLQVVDRRERMMGVGWWSDRLVVVAVPTGVEWHDA